MLSGCCTVSSPIHSIALWEAVHRWAGIPMFYEHHAITSKCSLHIPEQFPSFPPLSGRPYHLHHTQNPSDHYSCGLDHHSTVGNMLGTCRITFAIITVNYPRPMSLFLVSWCVFPFPLSLSSPYSYPDWFMALTTPLPHSLLHDVEYLVIPEPYSTFACRTLIVYTYTSCPSSRIPLFQHRISFLRRFHWASSSLNVPLVFSFIPHLS
jgi:hypothetical protein